MIKAEEKRLITLLRQDDKTALKEIFDQYHAPLCQVSYNIVRDSDEAKDVVQDVLFKLWQKRKELTIESSLFAYLKRAVVNTSLNALEKQKKFSRADLTKTEEAAFASQEGDQHQLAHELSCFAEKAIENLPVRTKAVFRLIRFEEMSYREVAENLNISLKAVEKEMMKALRLLREALKDYLPLFFISTMMEAIHYFFNFF